MVEPLYFTQLNPAVAKGDRVILTGSEAKHASVRRLRVGEPIALSDGAGLKARGFVVETSRNDLLVEIDSVARYTPPKVQLTLVQALAKGDRDELAIQAATELGVAKVIPWQAERSVVIWSEEKQAHGLKRWQSVVAEAAKQSLRPMIPTVSNPQTLEQLFQLLEQSDLVLVLEPTATLSLSAVALPTSGEIAVIVGPEGGISAFELESFAKAGFVAVSMGSGILRTSTAPVAAIALIQSRLGNWS